MPPAPDIRRHRQNTAPIRQDGSYILYWMTAERRATWSFGLQHAADLARTLGRPLLVFEALDLDYPWASTRFHTFVLQGMVALEPELRRAGAGYFPYVAPTAGAGRGLLAKLAERACAVIVDERPGFRYPSLVASAARLPVWVESVDGGTAVPLRTPEKEHTRAVDYRRFLHKLALAGRLDRPEADPLRQPLPPFAGLDPEIERRWPSSKPAEILATDLAGLALDRTVGPVAEKPGGAPEAQRRWSHFLTRLERYPERNHPDAHAPSGLSPWLHFGHVGPSQLLWEILDREAWAPERMSRPHVAKQQGAWGLSPGAEAFLEELATWRELAFHTAFRQPTGHATYAGIPPWCQRTLEAHAADPREHTYTRAQLAAGATDDPLWNAAQRELRETGVIHNYLRMLWGKRVLAWARDPEEAFDHLVDLNNRYALDGRDPNSYAGIAWCFGRYDRPWGPERPIYGTVRFMSSASTRKKLDMDAWARRFGA